MDVQVLATKYGIISQGTISKAQEYVRRVGNKSRALIDQALSPACLVVAGRANDEVLDLNKLCKYASVNTITARSRIQAILAIVGANSVIRTTPSALCLRFGCESISTLVDRVYEEYLKWYQHRKRQQFIKGSADINVPLIAAACLFACSKRSKLHVDEERLLEVVLGNPTHFHALVKSIEVNCPTSLSGALVLNRKRPVPGFGSPFGNKKAGKKSKSDYDFISSPPPNFSSPQPSRTVKNMAPEKTEDSPSAYTRRRLLQKSLMESLSKSNDGEEEEKSDKIATKEEYLIWKESALAFMKKNVNGI